MFFASVENLARDQNHKRIDVSMNPAQRIRSVYRGETPDRVPFMLDLSHWFLQKSHLPWNLATPYEEPEYALLDYHKKMGVGFYLPTGHSFVETKYPSDVRAAVCESADRKAITWRFETSLGKIERTRVWGDETYSWGIAEWGIQTREQLRVLGYALGQRTYKFMPERFRAWTDAIGDLGVCYVGTGYSGMGHLLGYWMGIENTMFATVDWPDTLGEVVNQINRNNLQLVDVLAASPVEFVFMGDNFSSDIQPPHFFDQWSREYYTEAVSRLHEAGKFVAVHIDGKLSGALKMIAETGADCADAVTPRPMGDLTPQQCRDESGPNLILSGGVSPNLWLPTARLDDFKKAVLDWLELKKQSARLIMNAGDQVPPGAPEERIELMRDLVEKHGRY